MIEKLFTVQTDSGITTLNPKCVSAYTHTPKKMGIFKPEYMYVEIHMKSGTIFCATMNMEEWQKWKEIEIGE